MKKDKFTNQFIGTLNIGDEVKTCLGEIARLVGNNGPERTPYTFIVKRYDNGKDDIIQCDGTGTIWGPHQNYSIINTKLKENENLDLETIFKKLPRVSIDEACRLCTYFVGKCFKRHFNDGREMYVKFYDIKKIDGYITAVTNRAYSKCPGRGTFSWEQHYDFTCKDKSEYLLWMEGTHSPRTTYKDYEGFEEISDEEFKKGVRKIFEEYYENEINC